MIDSVLKTDISIVIPVYQGADYLLELLRRIGSLRDAMERSGLPIRLSECICVNDSAIDSSAGVLSFLQPTCPWLQVVTLSRNFGQHPATLAGILHSSGDWVITLDDDLQHEPERILLLLLEATRENLDVVYAKPAGSVHESLYRNTASRWVKACVARLAGNPHIPLFNSFRAIRGTVARAAASSCASETYLDVALTWITNSIGSVTLMMTDPRLANGKASGYSFQSLVRHAFRMLVTSDSRLLRFGARLGILGMSIGIFLGLTLATMKLFYPSLIPVQGWASTIVIMLVVNSLIALQCGIAMKFLSLILQRSQGRPTFFIVDRTGDQALFDVLRRFAIFGEEVNDADLTTNARHAC